LDATYRRCHLSIETAQESQTVFDDILLMALWMTFGGSPCPAMWSYIGETLADLCNSIIQNTTWVHTCLFDPLSLEIGSPLSLPDDLEFHSVMPLLIKVPDNDLGNVDIYLDNSRGIVPDIDDNAIRVNRAIPLIIHALARPLDEPDQLPRKDIISLKKLKAEGWLEECKLVLGWQINTRTLTISLPKDKFITWTAGINRLSASRVKHKDLERLIGRLNHVAGIYKPMRHFLGRL
jgi:hypothetical protein